MAVPVQLIAGDPSSMRAPLATWRAVLAFIILTYALSRSRSGWAGGFWLVGRKR